MTLVSAALSQTLSRRVSLVEARFEALEPAIWGKEAEGLAFMSKKHENKDLFMRQRQWRAEAP